MACRQRSIVSVLVGVLLVLVALPAAAQAISLAATYSRTPNGKRPTGQKPEYVSYADCVNGDRFNIEAILVNPGPYELEVWASTSEDCTLKDEREGTAASCWKVAELDPSTNQPTVTIHSRDIAVLQPGDQIGAGTIATCENATDDTPVTLWFLMVDSTNVVQGSATFASGVDLIGPSPPTGLSAGIGEDRLIIGWDDAPNDDDLRGYRFYCDPPPGGSTPASTPTGTGILDGGADATTDGGTTTDGGGTTTDGGGTTTDGGTTGPNPGCPSALDALVGERPDEAYFCGSVTGQFVSGGDAEGLTNGVSYAVAVAAVDQVGNSGPLSETVCGTPQPVDDFFELYRRAGGKGGGGFCQISSEPATGLLALMASALFALGLRRRRNR